MSKILITGGAGFIGSYLCKHYIEANNKVVALDNLSTGSLKNIESLTSNKNFNLEIGDVTDPVRVNDLVNQSDIVIHMAAVVGVKHVMENPVDTIRVNILGTENILHSCSLFGKRVLIASTSEVYGKAMQYIKSEEGLDEESDTVMGNTSVRRWSYATSKALDEFLALAYYEEKNLAVNIVRYFNTVGPGQIGDYGMVLPIFIQKALKNEDIPVFGDGEQMRSFGHVVDAVKCTTALIDKNSEFGQVFNIGNQNEISINELAKRVINYCESSSKIKYIPYDKAYGKGFEDMKRRKPNTKKIKKAIGFAPEIGIEKIIGEMVVYFKSN